MPRYDWVAPRLVGGPGDGLEVTVPDDLRLFVYLPPNAGPEQQTHYRWELFRLGPFIIQMWVHESVRLGDALNEGILTEMLVKWGARRA